MKKAWWHKQRTCLRCGHKMNPGMLPGYFHCGRCGFFMDIQDMWDGSLRVLYNLGTEPSLLMWVPNGTLAVFSWDEA